MRVRVDLAERGYDVVIEDGARHRLDELIATRLPQSRLAVLVAPVALQRLDWFDFAPTIPWTVVTVPDGEHAKTLQVVEQLCSEFSSLGLSRRDVVVGIGGGATTDVAGFAAAVYQRGVSVIHVATSLVAQVDAAIGGKTGVNISSGKNMIGSFHQPVGVLCDLSVLATLPERDQLCGFGEIAKCWLLESRTADELERTTLLDWITASVQLKAAIVSSDEREGGQRALLNYGHTLAHALEAQQLAGRNLNLRHGEAVAIGLAYAVRLARDLGRVTNDAVADHDAVLDFFHLPRGLPDGVNLEELIVAMGHDKKAHHSLTFVLADGVGFATVADVPVAAVRSTLEKFKEGR